MEPLTRELVQTFFESTVHTLCPAVDETEFMDWYNSKAARRGKAIGPRSSLLDDMVFKAILFAAFPYVSGEQLAQTPSPFGAASVAEGMKTLFDHARQLYHDQQAQYPGHRALVQTALLLSHWSPYDESDEVNSFWADEAFHHARLGAYDLSRAPKDRILWWCVVSRNRTLALGLRRPHKLKRCTPGPVPTLCELEQHHQRHHCYHHRDACDGDDDHDDYQDVATSGMMTRVRAVHRQPVPFNRNSNRIWHNRRRNKKTFAMQLFLKMCWLADIMNSVVLLRHSTGRWDDWRECTSGGGGSGCSYNGTNRGNHNLVDTVAAIDQVLLLWFRSLEVLLARYPSINTNTSNSSSRRCRVSVQMLRVMGLFVLSLLLLFSSYLLFHKPLTVFNGPTQIHQGGSVRAIARLPGGRDKFKFVLAHDDVVAPVAGDQRHQRSVAGHHGRSRPDAGNRLVGRDSFAIVSAPVFIIQLNPRIEV